MIGAQLESSGRCLGRGRVEDGFQETGRLRCAKAQEPVWCLDAVWDLELEIGPK